MKKLMISMLALAGIASCSSEEILNEPVDNGQPVPVVLSAQTMEILTKGIVDQGTAFKAQVVAKTKAATDYNSPLWGTDASGQISVTAAGAVSFNEGVTHFYPTDGSEITMRGFAPQSTNIASSVVSYTIDGTQDIMVSNEVTGSKATTTAQNLQFAHLLTQLKVEVIASSASAIEAWGDITSIKIKQADTKLELNLKDGTLTSAASPTPDDLSLEGFTNPLPLATTTTQAGSILVKPSTSAYILLITTTKKTAETEVELSLTTTEASKSHKITLTFNSSDVAATAAADKWEDGNPGNGTVK